MRLPLTRYLVLFFMVFPLLPQRAVSQAITAGGELSYKFLYRQVGEFVYDYYQVTFRQYTDCYTGSSLPSSVELKFAVANPPGVIPSYEKSRLQYMMPQTGFEVKRQFANECSPEIMPVCNFIGTYSTIVQLPELWGEYIAYVQENERKSAAFINVNTDGIGKRSGGIMGYTYVCRIPGLLFSSITVQPSSPVVKKDFPMILCCNSAFRYDFSANDPDGDSLSYSFVPAYQGEIYTSPRFPETADQPPFYSLIYIAPYSGQQPLGPDVQIDPVTGMINGRGPSRPGRYVVAVEIAKFRGGQLVTRHRKEVDFIFSNCTSPRAQLDSLYRNCKGTTVHFTNYSTGQISKYSWDFGDPTTLADTSSLAEPDYHYPAPGTYTAKLFLNKGTTLCKDSVSCSVVVDSGMHAAFKVQRSLAFCNEAVYDFTNQSTAGSNPLTGYAWDFGELSTTGDVSSNPDASYVYPTEGSKTVRLIIQDDFGCSDTAFKKIQVFKSVMRALNDTAICYLDTIALRTNTNGYPGVFNWSPDYRISSLTAGSPLVNPQRDTAYFVSFTDTTGCVARDTVNVKVRHTVNIRIDNFDTTICKLDSIQLKATHDGLSVTWQPASSILPVNPDGSEASAFPGASTDVIATSHFGSCFAEDTMHIKVVPQPQVTVINDTAVCLGAPVYLQASGGSYYLWAPAATLDNPVSQHPIAHPVQNTIYSVSVFDTLGCPKHTIATVKVNTFRGLIALAGKDTMVVEGEPVQLTGSGGQYYHWSPALYLSDPLSQNPVARPYGDITYVMKISNDDQCTDSARVRIRAFKDPDIYVPTAFTPNNDGKNDLFKVFPVGFELTALKVYDRWGNLVYSTTDYTRGWDGKVKGVVPSSGVFIWVATGKNKKTGAAVLKKGQVTLIR